MALAWQSKLASATSKFHAFLDMDDDERVTHEKLRHTGTFAYKISRVPGHVTWVSDLKAAFLNVTGGELKEMDASVLGSFGFSIDASKPRGENVCKSCKQIASVRNGTCCPFYDHSNRVRKVVISHMNLERMILT